MKYKSNNKSVPKLQTAWTTMPTFKDAFNRAFDRQNAIRDAEQKAKEQVASEKPKYTFVNPYDITRGWREATEDAAKQDMYTALNSGSTIEDALKIYNDVWSNARKQLTNTTATILPTVGLMAVSMGAAGPIAAHTVNAGFAIDSLHRLASDKGIKKTIRLANSGDQSGAIRSAAGDLLDLSGLYGTGRIVSKLANPAYRSYHAYNVIAPYGYQHPFKRGKDWIKSMLSETTYTEPKWLSLDKDSMKMDDFPSYMFDDLSKQARQDAWAIYNNQPMTHGMYVPIEGNRTYSYNLDKFKHHMFDKKSMLLDKQDYLGRTHGGLHHIEDIPINETHGNLYIDDVYDLNPFERKSYLFSKQLRNWLLLKSDVPKLRDAAQNFREFMYNKGYWNVYGDKSNTLLGKTTKWLDSPLNKFRNNRSVSVNQYGEAHIYKETPIRKAIMKITSGDFANKVDDIIKNFEIGTISGGKPFTMKTNIPYTRVSKISDITKKPIEVYFVEKMVEY